MPIFDIEKYFTDFITNPGEPEIVADCEYKEVAHSQARGEKEAAPAGFTQGGKAAV